MHVKAFWHKVILGLIFDDFLPSLINWSRGRIMSFSTGLEVGNHYLYNPLFSLYGDVANITSMLRNIKGCGFIRLPSSIAAEFFF